MKTILIVDDDKTSLLLAKTVLSEKYKVIAVTMGSQALKFLETNSCDLVLLDVEMPEMDGFAVLEEIQKMDMGKELPVVFLTGNTDGPTLTKCINRGAAEVITKPVIKSLVEKRLDNLLELYDFRNAQ